MTDTEKRNNTPTLTFMQSATKKSYSLTFDITADFIV